MKKHTFLKVKDFFLYSIPIRLSFSSGQVLLALSERERTLIEGLADKPQQLRMRFNSPLFGKEMGLFVKAYIQIAESSVGNGNFSTVNMEFVNPADDFKEILIELFLLEERLRKIWIELGNEKISVPNTLFKKIGIENSTHITLSGSGKFRCLFKSISPQIAEIYISDTLVSKLPDESQKLTLELNWNKGSFMVGATKKAEVLDTHQEKVKLLTLSLDFSTALTELLLPTIELIKNHRHTSPASDKYDGENPIQEAEAVD